MRERNCIRIPITNCLQFIGLFSLHFSLLFCRVFCFFVFFSVSFGWGESNNKNKNALFFAFRCWLIGSANKQKYCSKSLATTAAQQQQQQQQHRPRRLRLQLQNQITFTVRRCWLGEGRRRFAGVWGVVRCLVFATAGNCKPNAIRSTHYRSLYLFCISAIIAATLIAVFGHVSPRVLGFYLNPALTQWRTYSDRDHGRTNVCLDTNAQIRARVWNRSCAELERSRNWSANTTFLSDVSKKSERSAQAQKLSQAERELFWAAAQSQRRRVSSYEAAAKRGTGKISCLPSR